MLFRVHHENEIELIPVLRGEYEALKEIAKANVCPVAFADRPYIRFLFTGDTSPVLKALKTCGVKTMKPAK